MKITTKECGWGRVDYSPYFYTGRIVKRCEQCGKFTEMDEDENVFYSGGIMKNSCHYCGAPLERGDKCATE